MTTYFLRILTAILIFSTPLHAQNTNVPEGYESFEAYEIAMFERIDELAVQRGANTSQVSQIHQLRDELRVQYADARNRNDKAGMAEAQALQAHLIRVFLEQLSQ